MSWRAMVLVLAMLASAPGAVAAQSGITTRGGIVGYTLSSRTASVLESWRGTGLGWQGTVAMGRLLFRLAYADAALERHGGGEERILVDGEALAGVRLASWLNVWVGPHARAYADDQASERLMLWEVRTDLTGPLALERLRWFLEGWGVVGAQVDAAGPFQDGVGADVGLGLRLIGRSLWARFTYRVDQVRLAGASRRDTYEAVGVWLQWSPGASPFVR